MELTKLNIPNGSNVPIRKSARRLRWFKETLYRQIDALTKQTGIQYLVDDCKIRTLFFRWLKAFEEQKPESPEDREDFVDFASGLMLRELVTSKPVSVIDMPKDADQTNPAFYWPEGFLYLVLCLNIRSAIHEQEFDKEIHVSPCIEDLQTWWSFKENVEVEDSNLAIGFFDLFAGVEPNWYSPTFFSTRKSVRNQAQHLKS